MLKNLKLSASETSQKVEAPVLEEKPKVESAFKVNDLVTADFDVRGTPNLSLGKCHHDDSIYQAYLKSGLRLKKYHGRVV